MAQMGQRFLKGDGIEERIKSAEAFMQIVSDGAIRDKALLKPFYDLMCEDILRERRRIGGDWAVATVVFTREYRDMLRSRLGPNLVIVNLEMDPGDLKKRVLDRHEGDETAADLMGVKQNSFDLSIFAKTDRSLDQKQKQTLL